MTHQTLDIDIARSQDVCKYYIAGPMSGYPEYNFPAFERAAQDLRSRGWIVFSPHEIQQNESPEERGNKGWAHYMRADLKLLLECDALVLLEGWANSKGAMQEFQIAKALGMDCLLYIPDQETFEVI